MPCVKEARKRQRVESGDHNTEHVNVQELPELSIEEVTGRSSNPQPFPILLDVQRGYIYVIPV